MRDDEFDKSLKEKLRQADGQVPDWEAMQARLDREDGLDDHLDRHIADLASSARDKGDDWSDFADKVDLMRRQHRLILTIKATELVILLLAFGLFGYFAGIWQAIQTELQPPVLMADATTAAQLDRSTEHLALLPFLPLDLKTTPSRLSPQSSSYFEVQPTTPVLVLAPTTTANLTADRATLAAPSIDRPSPKPITQAPSLSMPSPALAELSPESPPKEWLLGAGFSRNVDIIHTPNDQVYRGLGAYTTLDKGISADLSLMRRIGSIDIGTGLGYTRQSYDPRPFSETNVLDQNKVVTAKLDDISFDIIKVPIHLTYHFLHKGRFTAFVQGGLLANFLAQANYQVTQEEQSQDRRIVRAIAVSDGAEINNELQLAQKDFTPGLLSGGSLKDNLYLTAALAVGAEFSLADDTYLRASLGYTHNFGVRMGPNQDRIHSIGMRLGVAKVL